MKKSVYLLFGLSTCMSLSGCGLMEMSFKAGVIMALILAAIVGLLIWILHITVKLLKKYFPALRYYIEGFWEE